MVEIGTGIAIAGICIPAAAVIMTAIRSKPSSNGNGNGGYCKAHSGIEEMLKALKDGQLRIEKNIERIFHLHDEGKL